MATSSMATNTLSQRDVDILLKGFDIEDSNHDIKVEEELNFCDKKLNMADIFFYFCK